MSIRNLPSNLSSRSVICHTKNKNTQLKLVRGHRGCRIMLACRLSQFIKHFIFLNDKECHKLDNLLRKKCSVSSVHSLFIKVSQRIITWQAETEANTGLLSLGAQRSEAIIFCSSIASAKDSFVVIATDVHFYPSSDRLKRWDQEKKKSKDTRICKNDFLFCFALLYSVPSNLIFRQ